MLAKGEKPVRMASINQVSILIMLEDAREEPLRLRSSIHQPSFNPNYAGRCSRSKLELLFPLSVKGVSILIMLEDARESPTPVWGNCHLSWFQS